jgi:regulator of nucleoside diphosphate kinase
MTTTILATRDARGATTPHITISDRDHARLLRYVDGRARDLERLEAELARAEVVPAALLPLDVVTMGSRVVYEDTNSGVRRVVSIVFPDSANVAEGRVSVLAPIGSALIGLRVGDAIDWELPNRRHTRLRVVALEHQER